MTSEGTASAIATPSGYEALLAMDSSVLEAIPVAAYVCAADGLIVRFNRRASELWGFAWADSVQANSRSTGVPPAARSISVVSAKRTSIRPVSAAMVGSAPSIRSSSRMVSIFSRLLEYVTEPPVRFPTGEPARLIEP
jgi:hypothetical protein